MVLNQYLPFAKLDSGMVESNIPSKIILLLPSFLIFALHVEINQNCNSLFQMKDFSLADFLMNKLVQQPDLSVDQKRALFSAWGRIFLQCGDVFGAEQKFSESRRIRGA